MQLFSQDTKIPRYQTRKNCQRMIVTRYTIFFIIFVSLIVKNCNGDTLVETAEFNQAPSEETMETHHATCKITTKQLVANAQSTFKRVLKGACNAKTMESRFNRLENLMNERMDEIKDLIANALSKEWNFEEVNKNNRNALYSEQINTNSSKVLLRDDEVKRFNNTVHLISISNGHKKVYTYYWRVTNVDEKLFLWETGRSERSPIFYIGDSRYAMVLRITPRSFYNDKIFISGGLTKGEYDDKVVWPFLLQTQIEILDIVDVDKPKDRTSRLWDPALDCSFNFWGRPGMFDRPDNPECIGLSVPRQLITGADNSPSVYVTNNSLLVKLTVYL